MTVFFWPGIESSTKLSRLYTKTDTPFFQCVVGHTFLPLYGNQPTINSGQFNTFSYQKLDNALLLFNRQILQHDHHPVFIPCHLDNALYQSLWSLLLMRVLVHFAIHNGDSSRIPSFLATFPLSGTGEYAKGTLLWRFVLFHPFNL